MKTYEQLLAECKDQNLAPADAHRLLSSIDSLCSCGQFAATGPDFSATPIEHYHSEGFRDSEGTLRKHIRTISYPSMRISPHCPYHLRQAASRNRILNDFFEAKHSVYATRQRIEGKIEMNLKKQGKHS